MKIKRSELKRIIENYLLEESKVYADRDYEYIFNNGFWSTRKKGSSKWISLKNNKEASSVLNNTYPEAVDSRKPAKKDEKEESGSIEFYDRIPDVEIEKFLPQLSKGRDAVVSSTEAEGCAQWVNSVTGYSAGNAWHQHANSDWSVFDQKLPEEADNLALIFKYINKNPKERQASKINGIRNFVKSIVPDQKQFSDLDIGDIVGLFYYSSTYHAIAFYESATGTMSLGSKGEPGSTGEGPFFENEEGESWNPSMIGQDINFAPSSSLKRGGFGMNTHIGVVGAKIDGEPVVFHNIHGKIHATPLRALAPSAGNSAIVWYQKGETLSSKARRFALSVYDYFLGDDEETSPSKDSNKSNGKATADTESYFDKIYKYFV